LSEGGKIYEQHLLDQRLARRAEALQQAMVQQQSVRIAALAQDWAEQMAYYRLLRNERVEEADLIEGLCGRSRAALEMAGAPLHVLAIQDTTQLNFEAQAGRHRAESGLGVIGDGQSSGCFLHPTLLVDATHAHALGFSDVQLWRRDPQRPGKAARRYKQQPLEAKESARWVDSLLRSRSRLGSEVHVTGVLDREGDLYPLFARLPDAHTDLIVRACRDRGLLEGSQRLFAHLAQQPCLGRAEIEVRGDVRTRQSARRAELAYRIAEVRFPRPSTWPEEAESTGPLWAIEVREVPESVPQGEEAIHWRLVTTHRVETLAQVQQVVGWYRERWHIEQVFRLLKLEGLDVESSALSQGHALRRLSVLALGAALDVLRLLRAERSESTQPLEQVFAAHEQACLEALAQQVQGRTQKQKNPHAPHTLGWAAWIIARLGGWKGYRSQRPAGPITYRRGLVRFANLCEGFRLRPPDLYRP
jgi:hypothetical protein